MTTSHPEPGPAKRLELIRSSTDPIAALLRRIRVKAIVPGPCSFTSPWALRLYADAGAFCVALEGRVWFAAEGQPPVELQAGDAAVLLVPAWHTIGSPAGAKAHSPLDLLSRGDLQTRKGITATRGAPTAVFQGGGLLEIEGIEGPIRRVLPPIIVLRKADPTDEACLRTTRELLSAIKPGTSTQDAIGDLAATHILIHAAHRAIEQAMLKHPTLLRALLDQHIGPVVRLLCDFPERKWNMESLANEAGLSRSMFHERFVAAVHEPPMSFLRRLRLDLAKQLLATGGTDLTTIARRTGYRSTSALTTVFRKTFGQSPADYKRERTEAAPPHSASSRNSDR